MVMENVIQLSIFLFLVFLPLLVSSTETKVHIVYFGEHSGEKTVQEIEEIHHSYLLSVKETEEDAKSSLLYSYKHSINGFAAFLTPYEASKLSGLEEVVSVFPSNLRKYSLHTTRSWEFLGLQETGKLNNSDKEDDLLLKSNYGKNVIVGVIDSGVWPESQSFNDEEMGPIPKSWKGTCQSGDAFNSSHCNKKIIGARYYIKGYEAQYGHLNQTKDFRSPRDRNGHGTHTSSTVGGRRVKNVSALGGFARGTASGGAPLAQLAIYKVFWGEEQACTDEDLLAAIDDAIADGVHVLSMSLGLPPSVPYDKDPIAIGALHAVKKNIVVACAAGNAGPAPATVSNVAPWIFTVGASSVDRIFPSTAVLGNGINIAGQTVTPYKMGNRLYPLVFAGQVINAGVPKNLSGLCLPDSLSPEKAKGKIVLCFPGGARASSVGKGVEVQRAGGIGLILGNSEDDRNDLVVDAHVLPATAVNYENAVKIQKYIESTKEPKANIGPAMTVLDAKPAPFMAGFSSRGPSTISPNILKPDITAPGLNILAAWSEASSPSELADNKRVVKYNIESGTSMACPHIAAVSALLKAVHPDWSSAAIRSALMTSAGQINNEGKPITDTSGGPADPFQFGSGHLRPTEAVDPGLIYDTSYEDYLLFLCSTGVINCPEISPSPANLNYPSVAIPDLNGTVTVVRTVTNVGSRGKSVYVVGIKPPQGFSVNILPTTLYFNQTGQKISFTITVTTDSKFKGKIEKDRYSFGYYTWSDGVHTVRSPMAVSHA